MSIRSTKQFRVELIKSAIESISIPDGIYKKAMERYGAVTTFLDDPRTLIGTWKPSMDVQGSIALGIATRPIGRDDFDFDVTLEFLQSPSSKSAMEIRNAVAERLRQDSNYARMLNTEKNRCLRLDYAKQEQFYLDIIVARSARWIDRTGTGIQVPDRALANWIGTDPKGYIVWFEVRRDQIQAPDTYLLEKGEMVMVTASAAPPPEQDEAHEKLPLQWVIQIMKRHRDLMFREKMGEDAPISIILTTLAAKAYRGEQDFDGALAGITDRLGDQFDDSQKWKILNPVIPSENFADKWPAKPHRRKAFFDWYDQFKVDVDAYLNATKIASISKSMDALVGDSAKTAALAAHSAELNELQDNARLGVITTRATLVPATTPGSKVIPYHNDYGSR